MPQSARNPKQVFIPDFALEDQHNGIVCGIDEVGRGPLAGPVVAACVIIPDHLRSLEFIPEIKDSKKLSLTKRNKLYELITQHFPYAISEISPKEIDEINILQASLKAMEQAFLSVSSRAKSRDLKKISPCASLSRNDTFFALIDGNKIPANLPCPAKAVVKGDSKSVSIAAASIIAKVHRDILMTKLALEFPHYGWERNAGYPTKDHIAALETHGITPHHRKSFAPVRRILESSNI
tara:strand:- start:206 stop:916 length:711 start_codon:yes stop_codon:yes gene_type:complete